MISTSPRACGFKKQRALKSLLKGLTAFFLVAVLVVGFVVLFHGAEKPREICTLVPAGGMSKCVLFSRDNELIIVGSNSLEKLPDPAYFKGELSIWKMSDKSKWKALEVPHHVSSLSVDQKGKLLAVAIGSRKLKFGPHENAGRPRQIHVLSIPDLKEMHLIQSENFIKSANLSPDGTLLAAAVEIDGGIRSEVIVWGTADWTVKYKIADFLWWTTNAQFSPDGKLLAVTDYKLGGPFNFIGARIRLHDALTGKLIKDIALNLNEEPKSLHFLTNDRMAAEFSRFVSIWNTDGAEDDKIPLDFRQQREISFSGDRKILLIADQLILGSPKVSGQVVLWDIDGKKVLRQWDRQYTGPLAMTSDKKKLALGWDKVYLYDLDR